MRRFMLLLLLLPATLWARRVDTTQAVVRLETTMGNIRIALYDDTPIHRDNFIKLCDQQFYDSLLFHRVIRGFMIQAGDPDSRHAEQYQLLGEGGPGYDLPAEIVYPGHRHYQGVVAAAREGDDVNPERRSSGSHFYIVVGNARHLDGAYTVFGEVLEGMKTVLDIQREDTDENDRPVIDVRILRAVVERRPR